MYKEYIKDYLECEFIESEYGFIGYNLYEKEKFLIISNLFIKKEHRRNLNAEMLIKAFLNIGKEKGFNASFCDIEFKNPMHNESLALALKLGFKVSQVFNDKIELKREF